MRIRALLVLIQPLNLSFCGVGCWDDRGGRVKSYAQNHTSCSETKRASTSQLVLKTCCRHRMRHIALKGLAKRVGGVGRGRNEGESENIIITTTTSYLLPRQPRPHPTASRRKKRRPRRQGTLWLLAPVVVWRGEGRTYVSKWKLLLHQQGQRMTSGWEKKKKKRPAQFFSHLNQSKKDIFSTQKTKFWSLFPPLFFRWWYAFMSFRLCRGRKGQGAGLEAV